MKNCNCKNDWMKKLLFMAGAIAVIACVITTICRLINNHHDCDCCDEDLFEDDLDLDDDDDAFADDHDFVKE